MRHVVVRLTAKPQPGQRRYQVRLIDQSPAMSGGGNTGVPGGVAVGVGSWADAGRAGNQGSTSTAAASVKMAAITSLRFTPHILPTAGVGRHSGGRWRRRHSRPAG